MKAANRKRIFRLVLYVNLVLGLAVLASCGGGGTLPSPSGSTGGGSNSGNGSVSDGGNSGGGTTAVLVNLGEFASLPDNVVSFELTIDSVTLRSTNGDVSLLSNPRRFELNALKTQPVVLASAIQGNYSGVILHVSNPHISYIDSSGELHENVSGSLTSSIVINKSEFSLGGPPEAIDLNLFLQVSFGDGSSIAVTPELNFSTGGQPTTNLVARILDVDSSSNFDVDVDGLPPGVDPSWYEGVFSFAIGSSTKFQGLDNLGNLTSGMTVEVDAELRGDGALDATKVQLENDNPDKVVVEGLAVSTSLAQLQMLVREGHGPYTISRPDVGTVLTADANAATQFLLEPDGIDLDNLDFTPTFDALTIAPGQNPVNGLFLQLEPSSLTFLSPESGLILRGKMN